MRALVGWFSLLRNFCGGVVDGVFGFLGSAVVEGREYRARLGLASLMEFRFGDDCLWRQGEERGRG